MSLKQCRECGWQVSSNTKRCPSCGAKVYTFWDALFGLIGIIILVPFLFLIIKCTFF